MIYAVGLLAITAMSAVTAEVMEERVKRIHQVESPILLRVRSAMLTADTAYGATRKCGPWLLLSNTCELGKVLPLFNTAK